MEPRSVLSWASGVRGSRNRARGSMTTSGAPRARPENRLCSRAMEPPSPRLATLRALAWAVVVLLGCSRAEPPSKAEDPRAPAPRCAEWLRIDLTHSGASPAELEAMDVQPVEAAMSELERVTRVESAVVEDRALVWVALSSSAELAIGPAREALAELAAALPPEADHPQLGMVREARAWVVMLAQGPVEARMAVAEVLEQAVLVVPGTRRAHHLGATAAFVSVAPDPARLTALGLDAAMVIEALERALRPLGASVGLDDLASLEIATREGTPIRLRDVATLADERGQEGSRVWAGGREADLWVVEADDPEAVRKAVSTVPIPAGISIAMLGELLPQGCPSPALGRRWEGDFELLEFALAPGTEAARAAELVARAPTLDDAVWWTMDALLDDAAPSDPLRVSVLLPSDSPHRAKLLDWAKGVALELRGDHGPGRTQVVLALRHPDLERIHAGLTAVIEAARGRGLVVSTESAFTPQLDVTIDRSAAARLGVSVADVGMRLRATLDTTPVGFIRDGATERPVRVLGVGAGTAAPAPERLAGIMVPTPSGVSVPLASVATLAATTQPRRIDRSNRSRVGYVRIWTATEEERSTIAVLDELLPQLRTTHADLELERLP